MARKPGRAPPTADDRVVLLRGSDGFSQTENARALRRALRKAHGEIDVLTFRGAATDMGELLDECRSFGLMASHKLVELEDADEVLAVESRRGMLERYAESPGDGATLLIRRVSRPYPKLEKAVATRGRVVDCGAPSEAEASGWIVQRTSARHRATLDRAAAAMLVERHGADLARLDSEAAKLAVAAGEGGRITPEMVDLLAAGDRPEDPFRGPMRFALLGGDPGEAVRAVRDVMANAPRDAAVPVGICAMYAAKDVHARTAGNRRAPAEQVEAAKALLDLAIRVDVENKSTGGDAGRRADVMAVEFARISRSIGGRR